MTRASDLAALRRDLEARRAALLERLGRIGDRLRKQGEERVPSAGDYASIHFNDEVLEGLQSQERRDLVAIQHALARFSEGTYGSCVHCSDDIDVRRLEALPFAVTCVACAVAREQGAQ